MWLLKDDSGSLIYLKPHETLRVGRNKGDIVLSNDGSISRVHASITVEPVADIAKIEENTVPLSTCIVKDTNSKYGNFIIKNGSPDIKIDENGYTLRHMDRIRFGLQNYIFTALYVPIITATSGLNETEKNQLKQIIDAIDGKITYVWTSICTHMTIETPTISEKLSCALAFGTPIVSIDYWKAVFKAFQNNETFPEPVEFAAPINSKMAKIGKVCMQPNPMRKTCLQNLTFVHFNSKQYSLYNRMIKLSGGTSVKYGKQRRDLDVCNDNVIIVQLVESNTTQATCTGDANYAAVCEKLRNCRRRTIPECEIALAILHCSTDKYCNPKYDYAELFRNRKSQIPGGNSSILALDTQDVDLPTTTGPQRHTQRDFVPESIEQSSQLKSQPSKIVHQHSIHNISESTIGSSYHSDSIGSMKLVSLNHEKYLEEEFKKRSTNTENTMKRDRDGDVEVDVTKKKICLGISVDNEERRRNPSVPHKLQESFDDWMGDDEDIRIIDEQINAMKEVPQKQERNRDARYNSADVKKHIEVDGTKTKICLGISVGNEERSRNPSVPHKLQESFDDWMGGDEDICFIDGQINAIKEVPEKKERKRDANDNSTVAKKHVEISRYRVSEANRNCDVDVIDASVDSDFEQRAQRHRTRVFESKERTSLTTDDNEASRKRKVGRTDISPSLDVSENPHKRNKAMLSRETEIPQLSRQVASKEKTDFAQRKKSESEEGNWSRIKDYPPVHDCDSSADDVRNNSNVNHYAEISVFFRRPHHPDDTSTQRLLRITNPDALTDSAVPKFGKCFKKRHIVTPCRVEMYDASDDILWSNGTGPEKNTSFHNEEATTSHKVSPSVSKKTFRV